MRSRGREGSESEPVEQCRLLDRNSDSVLQPDEQNPGSAGISRWIKLCGPALCEPLLALSIFEKAVSWVECLCSGRKLNL
jgi:hypothetical protein